MIVEYHEAAFKHKVSESDIEWALITQVYEKPATDGSFLVVGYNRVGNPLEVAFRELDDGTLFVFHAMPCRQKWLDEANIVAKSPWRKMAGRPTDEEAWALEKMWTENPPELLEGAGPLTRRRELLHFLDDTSINYIMTTAEHDHKTPAQVVGDMVRERIAAAVVSK